MNRDPKEFSLAFLKSFLIDQAAKLTDLELENKPEDQQKIRSLTTLVDKLDKELKRRESETEGKETKPETSTSVATRDYTSHKIKAMNHTIASEIPVFSSGHDVHVWLNKLDGFYQLYVANEKDSKNILEDHFVQNAKSRLCPEYLNSMMASSVATNTFEKMKDYMKKHHASKMSVYQILDTLWEMDQSESDTFRDYGIKLDDKAAEAQNIIKAKYKEWAALETATQDKELTVDDVFKLISGQIFLQSLKNKKHMIYNNLCNDLDKTWSASEIANKAMIYSDRMAQDSSQNQSNVPAAFHVKEENKSRQPEKLEAQNCYHFLKGSCKYGDKCLRIHDVKMKKMFQNGSSESEDEEEEIEIKPNKSREKIKKKSKKSKKEKPSVNTAIAGYTKYPLDESMPIVPLPTQDFWH